MKTTIIIPTLNKKDYLSKVINSISKNTILPDEIIIINQWKKNELEDLKDKFVNLNIKILFQDIKSSSIARNMWVKESSWNILFFLDDDIIIDNEYINKSIKYFNENKKIKWVAPKDISMENRKNNIFLKLIASLFLLWSFRRKSSILISWVNTEINSWSNKKYIEYLSPWHMILRREIFYQDNIWFPNNFLWWSFGEWIYLSYQIFKKYNLGLIYLPYLCVENIWREVSKNDDNETLEKMKIIYKFIFWYKFVYSWRIISTIAYLWGIIWLFLVDIYSLRKVDVFEIKLRTYIYLFKNKNLIISNKIDFNKYIFENN